MSYIYKFFLTRYIWYFSQLTLKMSENVANSVRSDQRIAIYWPKSYLLVLFIIIVKAGVVPTKTDWNAMNLTKRYRERKKERRVTEEEKEERTNPKFCQCVGAFSVEIRTGNCSKSITLQAPIQPFCCVRAIEPITTKPHWVSVCRAVVCDTSVWDKKSALKIAAFRVSDWLRSATAWGLWMGPWLIA